MCQRGNPEMFSDSAKQANLNKLLGITYFMDFYRKNKPFIYKLLFHGPLAE